MSQTSQLNSAPSSCHARSKSFECIHLFQLAAFHSLRLNICFYYTVYFSITVRYVSVQWVEFYRWGSQAQLNKTTMNVAHYFGGRSGCDLSCRCHLTSLKANKNTHTHKNMIYLCLCAHMKWKQIFQPSHPRHIKRLFLHGNISLLPTQAQSGSIT